MCVCVCVCDHVNTLYNVDIAPLQCWEEVICYNSELGEVVLVIALYWVKALQQDITVVAVRIEIVVP